MCLSSSPGLLWVPNTSGMNRPRSWLRPPHRPLCSAQVPQHRRKGHWANAVIAAGMCFSMRLSTSNDHACTRTNSTSWFPSHLCNMREICGNLATIMQGGLAASAKPKPTVRALWRENMRSSQLSRQEVSSGKMLRRGDVFSKTSELYALSSSPPFRKSCRALRSSRGVEPPRKGYSPQQIRLPPSI